MHSVNVDNSVNGIIIAIKVSVWVLRWCDYIRFIWCAHTAKCVGSCGLGVCALRSHSDSRYAAMSCPIKLFTNSVQFYIAPLAVWCVKIYVCHVRLCKLPALHRSHLNLLRRESEIGLFAMRWRIPLGRHFNSLWSFTNCLSYKSSECVQRTSVGQCILAILCDFIMSHWIGHIGLWTIPICSILWGVFDFFALKFIAAMFSSNAAITEIIINGQARGHCFASTANRSAPFSINALQFFFSLAKYVRHRKTHRRIWVLLQYINYINRP